MNNSVEKRILSMAPRKTKSCRTGKQRYKYRQPGSQQIKRTRCLPRCQPAYSRPPLTPKCVRKYPPLVKIKPRMSITDAAIAVSVRQMKVCEGRECQVMNPVSLASSTIVLYLQHYHRLYTSQRCIYPLPMSLHVDFIRSFVGFVPTGDDMFQLFVSGFSSKERYQNGQPQSNSDLRFVITQTDAHWLLVGFDRNDRTTLYLWDSNPPKGVVNKDSHSSFISTCGAITMVYQYVEHQNDDWRSGYCALWHLRQVTTQFGADIPLTARHVNEGPPDSFIRMVADRMIQKIDQSQQLR